MERIVDKAIVFICACVGLAFLPVSLQTVAAMLVAAVLAALAELLNQRWRRVVLVAYVVAALVLVPLRVFLPLVVYDLVRDELPVVRALWIPALLVGVAQGDTALPAIVFGCALAFLLSRRTQRISVERLHDRQRHDDLREASLALEAKNADLRERQDLEVRLATLAERGRIAREIHDNVGHLLTRSIMQVEALQVVHRDDQQICDELSQVGDTLHEAMSTVRSSVHDLHDDAFDLETQLRTIAEGASSLQVDMDYRVDDVPAAVGTSFAAIVREALSNTVRHSDADHVAVSVVEHPGFYRLVVKDNGTSSPSGWRGEQEVSGDEKPGGRGIGLATMEDRANALGGVFHAEYDGGFKVFVSVPKAEVQAKGTQA